MDVLIGWGIPTVDGFLLVVRTIFQPSIPAIIIAPKHRLANFAVEITAHVSYLILCFCVSQISCVFLFCLVSGQMPTVYLLPSDPGGKCCSQCFMVSLPVSSYHWRLCSSSSLCHFQQFPHRCGFHADVLRLFPSKWAALWTVAEWPASWPGPHCSVLYFTIWRSYQFFAFQPRSYYNPGAWNGEVFWSGWVHASVSSPTHCAIHAIVTTPTPWGDRHQDWPLQEPLPSLGATCPWPQYT